MLGAARRLAQRSSDVHWALADQAVVSGTSFLTAILIARFLGPEEFGRFTLAWLGLFFAQNLQLALVLSPMMTIGAKAPLAERAHYTGAVLVQQAAVAFATAALVYLGALLAGRLVPAWHLQDLAAPLASAVFAWQISEFVRRYFFTFGRPRLSFAIDMVRYGGQVLALAVLLAAFNDYASVASLFHIVTLTSLAGVAIAAPHLRHSRIDAATTRRFAARHWRFARWLVPGVVAVSVRENVVYGAVGALLGLTEAGILRAAQQLVLMVNIPLQALANVVPMRAAEAFARGGYPALLSFVRAFVMPYMAAVALLLGGIALAGEALITALYGNLYGGAGLLVAAFAIAMLIYLVRSTISVMLHAMEATAYEFVASIAATVLIVATAYPMVGALGTIGAMVGMILYEAAMLAIVAFGLRRQAR